MQVRAENGNQNGRSRFLAGVIRGASKAPLTCDTPEARMYSLEAVKSKLEQTTGVARPSARQVKKHIRKRKPLAIFFDDNGYVPNNPKFPFLHYRNVLSLTEAPDPAAVFKSLFKTNGWTGNGIYDFHPFSSTNA